METLISVHEVRPRSDKRGFGLVSDALPFGRLWYGEPNAISNAICYAKFYSRPHSAIIRVTIQRQRDCDARAVWRVQRVVSGTKEKAGPTVKRDG